MITGAEITALLHALSTGFPDRALNLIATTPNLEGEDDLRRRLYAVVNDNPRPEDQARLIGDILRDASADQGLVNECYRAAFYLGPHWAKMAENPLYARFLANRSRAVLDKWIHYFPIYHRHFERFRGQAVRVLEIGVYRGGGLDMWQAYLGDKAAMVGIDVDPLAQQAVLGRHRVELGDQEDPEFLMQVAKDHGPFDVIIDDGGHTMSQQIVSAETLFPVLNDGGVYLVEDCHTSYWADYGGGLGKPESFIEWAKKRIDDMHSRYDPGIDQNSIWATHVDGMHVYDSVVVFDKNHRFRAFNEISGSSSYLLAGRFSEVLGVELLATRDAALRERDELRARIEGLTTATDAAGVPAVPATEDHDELRLARAELARLRSQLADMGEGLTESTTDLERTRNQLLESWEQVRQMRKTTSWRITRPLRLMRQFRG